MPRESGVRRIPRQSIMAAERNARKLFRQLFGEARGGLRRTEIIKELQARPSNPNQLAKRLGVDYKTIQHHLLILEENHMVAPSGRRAYGTAYLLTPQMEEALPILSKIQTESSRAEAGKPSLKSREKHRLDAPLHPSSTIETEMMESPT